ncbi:hypothetical protein NQ315_000871 [Exocentrus adspersus]|uniref:MADF domain-containing protein n=1 Tax=Exocentrus adspersus TaxID=1586481 RepID=A0AAV8WDU8_9CUCU|nr:hypothetical protein NQ315_000871 [Exocentrus adspersus]
MAECQYIDIVDIDIGLLIKLVQNFPHIYDHRHKNFKNNELKDSTWKRIAATLKVPVEDCLRVWKNLRDRFTREQRVIKTHPHDNSNVSKWEFYDCMTFLSPFIKRRRTITVRKRSAMAQNNLDSPSPATESKLWDPIAIKLSPESMSLLEGEFDDDSAEMEEVTFETELSDADGSRVNRNSVDQTSTINIVRHQTSEEAFGAYIATRLMELPQEIRQIKKAKLFKALEEPEEIS